MDKMKVDERGNKAGVFGDVEDKGLRITDYGLAMCHIPHSLETMNRYLLCH